MQINFEKRLFHSWLTSKTKNFWICFDVLLANISHFENSNFYMYFFMGNLISSISTDKSEWVAKFHFACKNDSLDIFPTTSS